MWIKKLLVWIFILAVVAFVAEYALHAGGVICHHEYDYVDCQNVVCNLCGHTKYLKEAKHDLVRVDCYNTQCRRCQLMVPAEEYHLKWCSSYDQCYGCGKDMSEYKEEHPDYHSTKTVYDVKCVVAERCTICGEDISVKYRHTGDTKERLKNRETCEIELYCNKCNQAVGTKYHKIQTVKLVNGDYIDKCAYCDYVDGKAYHRHTYNADQCGERGLCLVCGEKGKASVTKHTFKKPFLRVFDQCTVCGKLQYETSKMDWAARVAEVLAVFLTAFAFQYVVRRRKYMHIRWLTVIFMWLEENTHFGNFCPAVLWKKKLN